MSDGAHNLDPRLISEQGEPDRRPGDEPGSPAEPADALRFERRRSRGVDRRASVVDRRARSERVDPGAAVEGTARLRGVGRRLAESLRAAEEGELSREQFLFVMAIDAFKRENQVPFPAWTDVLEVVRLLGYRKTQPSELTLRNAEDWSEPADASSNVRPLGFDRRRAA
ncbi:MAG: hypothetical protein AB7K52_12235 [Phycisphaerales bacterium]